MKDDGFTKLQCTFCFQLIHRNEKLVMYNGHPYHDHHAKRQEKLDAEKVKTPQFVTSRATAL